MLPVSPKQSTEGQSLKSRSVPERSMLKGRAEDQETTKVNPATKEKSNSTEVNEVSIL